MRWTGQRESDNVEDRRGMRTPGRGVALGGGGIILLLAFSLLTGQDPLQLLQQITGGDQVAVDSSQQQEGQRGAPSDQLGKFASVVLASTEDVWSQQLAAGGQSYQDPRMVLFSGAVQSACGFSSAAVGPFYCPSDSKLYLDLSFFNELQNRFGAPGDFAQAYVIAHEVGHHVQNQLGIAGKVHAAQQQGDEEQVNALSVRMELQADCFAGVWANHANKTADLLEPGDIEEGLRAAAAIGDDKLQSQAQGYTVPETWTHGSSAQRVRWLKRGLESGNINNCDTFGARDL